MTRPTTPAAPATLSRAVRRAVRRADLLDVVRADGGRRWMPAQTPTAQALVRRGLARWEGGPPLHEWCLVLTE